MNGTDQEPKNGTDGTTLEGDGTIFDRFVGINEAITISRAGKSQISRDSRTKRLPYILNDKGHKQYSVKDLYNLYGFRKQDWNGSNEDEEPGENRTGTGNMAIELAVLKAELRAKEDALQAKDEALRRSQDEILDLRQTRDKLLDQNNRLTLLLPSPPTTTGAALAAPEPERSPEPPRRQPFWKRLFS